jgi:surface protein
VGWRLLSATGDQNCGVSTSGLIRVYAKTNAEQNQSPEANPVGEIREVRILVPDPADCTATTEVTYDFTEIATLIGADPADGFTYQATHPVDQATCESELPDVVAGCSIDNSNIGGLVESYISGDEETLEACGPIGTWDVSAVTYMYKLFDHKTNFNEDISGWDVSNVTDMGNMFSYASSFNHDISGWNVSSVTNMYGMFNGATNLNQGISGWDVSNVTDMGSMFFGASSFNEDISGWDVSKVTKMTAMFKKAKAFNQDLSKWNASALTNCGVFAQSATDWLAAYGGSIADKTPPLSATLIAAGCGN